MDQTTKSRAAAAMMAFMVVNALLFGAGILIAVMAAVPEAALWIPLVVIAGLVLAAPLMRDTVHRLRSHDWPAVHEPTTLRVQYRGYHRAG